MLNRNRARCLSVLPILILCASSASCQEAQETRPNYAAQTGTWILRVVGPDDEPVPDAKIDLRYSPSVNWKVIRGDDLGRHRYGLNASTDQLGHLVLELPEERLRYLSAGIEAKGYGLFWGRWDMESKSEKLPAEYTAQLDKGQSFGGIVVDPEGVPISGVRVHPSIEYKKRENDQSQLASGKSFLTDDKGMWSVHVIPSDQRSLQVSVSHPKFKKRSQSLPADEFGLKNGQQPTAKIALERGSKLKGRVVDSTGNPISGAIIRTVIRNRTLEAITAEDGSYSLENLEEGATEIVVTAKKFAPDLKTVSVTNETPDVDFALEPGNTVRVVVKDSDGNPMRRTRVFFQDWRGDSHDDELDKIHSYTDEDGVWVWDNAPADPIRVDICPPNSMQIVDQIIQANKANEFVAVPLLTIRCLVADDESGKKIERFQVKPGFIWPNRKEPFWSNRDNFESTDGLFTYKKSRVDGKLVLRIEADGYAPITSREIEWNEGRVGLAIKMPKAASTILRVVQPDGNPAQNATIALGIKGSQISLKNGEFGSSTFAERLTTDDKGQAKLKSQVEPLVLFVTHETGYSEAVFDPSSITDSPNPLLKIQLDSWGSVDGQLKQGDAPASSQSIVLRPNYRYNGEGLPSASHDYRTTTDEEGKFQFRKVIPGETYVGKEIVTFRSRTRSTHMSSHSQPVSVIAGETQRITIGGNGHRVVGHFSLPDSFDGLHDWEFSSVEIRPAAKRPEIPYPEQLTEQQRKEWRQSWIKEPDGVAWQAEYEKYNALRRQRFCCGVKNNGRFEIDDIPPGRFELEIKLAKPGQGAWGDNILATLNSTFEVPAFDESFQTVDLGPLTLELTKN